MRPLVTIRARLRHLAIVSWAVNPEVLGKMLPRPLVPQTIADDAGERFVTTSYRVSAADQHRVMLAKQDLTAARTDVNATRLIHKQRKIVIAVRGHLARSDDPGGGKPSRHQLQPRQGA